MQQIFSYRLKTARKEAGLKAKELAEILGISAAYLSQLEKGNRTNPGSDLIARIAAALKIPANQLIQPASLPLPTSGKPVSEGFQRLQKTPAQAVQGPENPARRDERLRIALRKIRLALDELEKTLEE